LGQSNENALRRPTHGREEEPDILPYVEGRCGICNSLPSPAIELHENPAYGFPICLEYLTDGWWLLTVK
jgi:hypothetical protein